MKTYVLMIMAGAIFAANGAAAQDRDGRDTAGAWAPTYTARFDAWDLVCDQRKTGDLIEDRCYLRYVDVFSPAPDFAALFSFVNATAAGLTLDFGIERGTDFAKDGFRLLSDGDVIWTLQDDKCLRRRDCMMAPDQAAPVIALMAQADRFAFTLSDRHGADQALLWDMTRFEQALTELTAQAAQRSLN